MRIVLSIQQGKGLPFPGHDLVDAVRSLSLRMPLPCRNMVDAGVDPTRPPFSGREKACLFLVVI